ncbi:MAG: hypothetical protein DWC06_01040 [Candidatus Poseidoniales archaeon]|nr:MAG: hypothetical protein DWC06_01040 [Candidatus Poseidoniales archaeon]
MTSNQCIPWQGNLACIQQNGIVIKSRHSIENEHVFGPDSDYTTLAISGLNLLSDELTINEVRSNSLIDDLTLQACGYLIDEKAEWTINCNSDASVSISNGEVQSWDIEGEEMDKDFHSSIQSAWKAEMDAVSQGAFVSEQAYRSGADSRMNFASQQLGDIRIWPPREMIGDQRPEQSTPLSQSGTIESWTKLSAGGAPSEFSLRAPILDGIGTVFVRMDDGPCGVFLIADDDSGEPEIGDKVTFAVRRLYAQDGLIRYGLKAILS